MLRLATTRRPIEQDPPPRASSSSGAGRGRPRPRRSRRWLRWLPVAVGIPVAAGVAMRLLNPLPPLESRRATKALPAETDTPLRQVIAPRTAAHPGESGVLPLTDGLSAFAARVHLARSAARTLDLQYYIWQADLSGTLLFDEVRQAADRGVRVRLLLDDNATSGLDPVIAALNAHPNVAVRLFNPFTIRTPRMVAYATDFQRLNRRMHNKAFIADNQAAVIGGRNIGDEYFGAASVAQFADLDLLSIGPIVGELSRSFDAYWSSGSSYPAERILSEHVQRISIAEQAEAKRSKPDAEAYQKAVARSDYASALLDGDLSFEWSPTRLVADDPAKGLGRAPREALLWSRLRALLGQPNEQLGIVSGYFVPTRAGVNALVRFAREGVKVKILTNAFEATDVPVVHSGYAKWRRQLLREGVELYEMRGPPRGDGMERNITALGSTGSGARGVGAALHAKTFSVDGKRIYIGSFNFDPRSVDLNTELGFVVESPALARRMREGFSEFIPENTYKVELTDKGELVWRERVGEDKVVTHKVEPGTKLWQRATVVVLSWLPIEWLL